MKNKFFYFGILPALFLQVIGAYLYFVLFKEEDFAQIIYFATKVLLVVSPIFWIFILKRRKFPKFFGGDRRTSLKWGIWSGLAVIALVTGVFLLLKDYLMQFRGEIVVAAEGLNFLKHYILFSFFLSIIHSFIEEYYWRWFVLNGLMLKLGKIAAIVVGSLAFAAHHLIVVLQFLPLYLALIATFAIFLIGAFWSYLYLKTNDLAGVWISHFCADAVIMGVGYFLIFGV